MDCEENKKGDIAGTPNAGTRDSKGKGKLLAQTPHGRNRPANTEDEIQDAKENKTSQEKVRIEQGGRFGTAL
jgi:hypothetical protein